MAEQKQSRKCNNNFFYLLPIVLAAAAAAVTFIFFLRLTLAFFHAFFVSSRPLFASNVRHPAAGQKIEKSKNAFDLRRLDS